ncbi:MAG: UDP-N-acetylmuramate dehydrogenase [Candidatus Saccharibacteria bacterium]|nr:UDP-N-acetylmuramate dehydrogenase [Candidatus Saccharibacteria bacterium]
MKSYENVFISSLTTMRIGGTSRHVLEIESENDIPEAYNFASAYWYPTYIISGGANTIGRDEGFDGVILLNRLRGFNDNNGEITVMAGENWDTIVDYACEKGYTGVEALSRIPGLVGAAPAQNIGAYGQELAGVFKSARAYDTATHTFITLEKKDMQFAYRKSIMNTTMKGRFFITSVTLEFKKGHMDRPFYNSMEKYIEDYGYADFSPKGVREIVSAIRKDKLPDPREKASAGSFFKNVYLDPIEAEKAEEKGYPVHRGRDGNKINSAWFVEQCGFKGQLLYGIRVNPAAPLVLINESAGTYANLARARAMITSTIYDKFGYWLEQEPVEIINTKNRGAQR